MEEVQEAASRCSLGVFLFTKDDSLTDDGQIDKHAPRDNVVFEAGYFSNAKGHNRVLVIRESGAKMPADLGGKIYLELSSKVDFDPIKNGIQAFIESI